MVNKKISDYDELVTPASDDLMEIVDISDTSEAVTGTNKKVQTSSLGPSVLSGADTGDLTEGSNLYYTEGRVSANTDVAANTTHRSSDGKDHSDVVLNNAHRVDTANPHSTTIDQVTPTTTKGDLLVENGTNAVRLPVGTNDFVLTADSTQATGVKWAAAAGGGGGTILENSALTASTVHSYSLPGTGTWKRVDIFISAVSTDAGTTQITNFRINTIATAIYKYVRKRNNATTVASATVAQIGDSATTSFLQLGGTGHGNSFVRLQVVDDEIIFRTDSADFKNTPQWAKAQGFIDSTQTEITDVTLTTPANYTGHILIVGYEV